MDYLPLNVDIADRPCLLVGGGSVARRKASLLLRAKARLTIVAPVIDDDLGAMAKREGATLHRRAFRDSDVQAHNLIVVATSDTALNRRIGALAQAAGLLVNVVDTPRASNVIFPAMIDRSPLILSVSSSGSAPVLSRKLRTELEQQTPQSYAGLARCIGRHRSMVRKRLGDAGQTRRFWESLIDSQIACEALATDDASSDQTLQYYLNAFIEQCHRGEVYLVGAGPGDPELLTLKAMRLIQKADVVFYDRLVSDGVLELARRDAERIYVGKAAAQHAFPQQDINHMLIERAQMGQRVVRLKGGDPFVFGRGGEEIADLATAGIPFQIVPGISAANGCACYAGIPLTHRDCAQAVRFVTGHLQNGSIDLPWDSMLSEQETLVFYMGLTGLAHICQQLVAHGRNPDTPAALIEKGTTPAQRVHAGTLATLPAMVEEAAVSAPTLIIVGQVVALREALVWR
mgnify:CR=1 FL=1